MGGKTKTWFPPASSGWELCAWARSGLLLFFDILREGRLEAAWKKLFHLLFKQVNVCCCLLMSVEPIGSVHSNHTCPCEIIVKWKRLTPDFLLLNLWHGSDMGKLSGFRGTVCWPDSPGTSSSTGFLITPLTHNSETIQGFEILPSWSQWFCWT
jgi:hypothetical protein